MPRWLREARGPLLALTLVLVTGCDEAPTASLRPSTVPPNPTEGATAPIAVIAQVTGDVRWQAASHGSWIGARADQPLSPSDGVQTMSAARATVRFLEGGASVELEPEAMFVVQAHPEHVTRLRHLSGRLVARLDPNTETRRVEVALPPGDFILEQAAGADEAFEARIDVEGSQTEISMIRGRGRMERESSSAIDIEEATFLTLDADGEILEVGVEGEPVELLDPAAGATVRTRSETSFRWAAGDSTRFTLRVAAEGGAPSVVATTEPRATLELESGRYAWSVRPVTSQGPGRSSESRTVEVVVDRSPPSLTITVPATNATHRGSTLVARGQTEAGASVEVNGTVATVSSDGSFSVSVSVRPGLNNLVFRAQDDLGNSRVVSRPVLVQ